MHFESENTRTTVAIHVGFALGRNASCAVGDIEVSRAQCTVESITGPTMDGTMGVKCTGSKHPSAVRRRGEDSFAVLHQGETATLRLGDGLALKWRNGEATCVFVLSQAAPAPALEPAALETAPSSLGSHQAKRRRLDMARQPAAALAQQQQQQQHAADDAAGATAARASRAAVRTAAKGGNPPAVCCATLPNHKGDPATITAWNVNGLGPRLDNNSGGQLI